MRTDTIGATAVRLSGGQCLSTGDCTDPARGTCDYATFSETQICDPESGQDSALPVGTCISPCDAPDVKELLSFIQGAITECSDSSPCGAGESCVAASGFDGCSITTCDAATGQVRGALPPPPLASPRPCLLQA